MRWPFPTIVVLAATLLGFAGGRWLKVRSKPPELPEIRRLEAWRETHPDPTLSTDANSETTPTFANEIESADSKKALEAILQSIAAESDTPLRSIRIALLAKRWLELDPDGAASALESFGSPFFAVWAETDPEAVAAYATENRRINAFTEVIHVLLRRDPDRAFALAEEHIDTSLAVWCIPMLASHDPERMAAMTGHLESQAAAVWNAMSETDARTAFRLAAEKSEETGRHYGLDPLFRNWMRQDPRGCTAMVARLLDDRFDLLVNHGTLEVVAQGFENTQDALDWIETLPEDYQKHTRKALLDDAWRHNWNTIVKIADSLPPAERASVISRYWVDRFIEPESVLPIFLEEGVPHHHLGNLGMNWAKTDPEKALARANTLEDADRQFAMLDGIARGWALADPEKAIEYFANPEFARIANGALGMAVHAKPSRAETWVPEYIATFGVETAQSGIRQWVRSQGHNAITWLNENLRGPQREQAMKSAIQNYTHAHGARGASEWVAPQPPGPLRDAVASGLVTALAYSDPEAAFAWGESITDPAKRSAALQETMRGWLSTDPWAARARLSNSDLSETDIANLMIP